jgi:hypothetical protein
LGLSLASGKKGKASFCEQKDAKNFVTWGRADFTGTGPKSQKFLRRFFQKAAPSLLPKNDLSAALPRRSSQSDRNGKD